MHFVAAKEMPFVTSLVIKVAKCVFECILSVKDSSKSTGLIDFCKAYLTATLFEVSTSQDISCKGYSVILDRCLSYEPRIT